jgi:hypothetical protein
VRRLGLLPAIVLAAGAFAAGAAAHGDPASQYLVDHQVFFPLRTPLPQVDRVRLGAVVREANRRGFPVRVAVVGSRFDLGVEADAWGKPAEYATNVAEDVAYRYRGPLLVVMPSGLGVHAAGRTGAADRALVGRIRVGSGPHGLAVAAIDAVRDLAAAHGVRVEVPRDVVTQAQRNRRDRIAIALAAAVGVALWTLAGLRRRRRAAAPA